MHSQHLPAHGPSPHMHHCCTGRHCLCSLVPAKRQVHAMQVSPEGVCTSVQIIAVHADDPEFKGYDDISQLPKHRLAEIRRHALPQCASNDFTRHGQCMPSCQVWSACCKRKQSTLLIPSTAAAMLCRFFEDYKKVGIPHVTAASCHLKRGLTVVSISAC